MTDTICIYTIRGPFGTVTGYGATQLDAKRDAMITVKTQEAQVKHGKAERRKTQAERVKQFSG